MPRIPIKQTPEVLSAPINVRGYIPPQIEHGTRELSILGSGLNSAARAVGDVLKFAEAAAQAKDQGIYNDIRLLDKQHTLENRTHMADNPGKYDTFPGFVEEQRQKYDQLLAEKLNGLTPDARRQANTFLASSALDRDYQMQEFKRHAFVSSELTRIENQMQTCVNINDRAEFDRILDSEENARILTPAMKEGFKAKYEEFFEINEIRNAAKNNDPKLIEKLDAVDSEGRYVNFSHITPGKRDEWRQHVVYLGNERFKENLAAFAASEGQGAYPTVEELNRQHENGEIDDRAYLAQKPLDRKSVV